MPYDFNEYKKKKKLQRQGCTETEMCRDRERVGICGCARQGEAMTGLECRGVEWS
jgi:hypothetical protein